MKNKRRKWEQWNSVSRAVDIFLF